MSNKNASAPIGNKNAAKGKDFFDALHKAIKSGKRGNSLAKVAEQLITIALEGDSDAAKLAALKEIADRLDGKAKQTIDANINQHDVSIDQLG